MNIRTKKIFAGGLSANLTEDDFKFYFEKFGCTTDVMVMHDNVTHRPRGFGFITFETEDSVADVMQKNFHELCGKLVEVKRAVPKEISTGGTTSGKRDSNFNSSHQQVPYSPRYDVLPIYVPIPGYNGYPYGMFAGGYPITILWFHLVCRWMVAEMMSKMALKVNMDYYLWNSYNADADIDFRVWGILCIYDYDEKCLLEVKINLQAKQKQILQLSVPEG
ncbi:RNA-binding protein 1 [Tanacetum coccineum]